MISLSNDCSNSAYRLSVNWTSYFDSGMNYTEVDIHGAGVNIHASAKSENLYKSFDLAIEKLEKQVQKKRKKIKDKMHRGHAKLVILDPEQAWTDYDEDYFSDAA